MGKWPGERQNVWSLPAVLLPDYFSLTPKNRHFSPTPSNFSPISLYIFSNFLNPKPKALTPAAGRDL